MKTLGKKSLSSILDTATNIIWWLEWIGFGTVEIAVIIVAIFKTSFAINVPVTFLEVTLKQVRPLNNGFPLGILKTTSGNLYLTIDATWQNVALLLTALTLVFTAVLMVTYQLKIIFSNFKRNVPFNEANISRIRNIAMVLIVYSVAQWLFVIVLNQFLASNLKWEDMKLTYSYNIGCFATGIVLIVVAEIFKQGTLLDNEQKLTI